MKHKYNIEKIDKKIEERKRIPLNNFIDIVEEMIRFKNEVKKTVVINM